MGFRNPKKNGLNCSKIPAYATAFVCMYQAGGSSNPPSSAKSSKSGSPLLIGCCAMRFGTVVDHNCAKSHTEQLAMARWLKGFAELLLPSSMSSSPKQAKMKNGSLVEK